MAANLFTGLGNSKETSYSPKKNTTQNTNTVTNYYDGSKRDVSYKPQVNTNTTTKTTTSTVPTISNKSSSLFDNSSLVDNITKKVEAETALNNSVTAGSSAANQSTDSTAATDAANTANTTSSYYSDLINALMQQSEQGRQDSLNAIMQNLDSVKATYKNQIQEVIDEYNDLIDQNEVAKERTRRAIKERQANRGQLDSGLGRQEQLDLDVGYDNKTADLNAARTKAVNEIYNLITQAEAEANTNKASVNNTYNNALLEYKLAQAS